MAEEITYSDREIDKIKEEILAQNAPQDGEVVGATFDINDAELFQIQHVMTRIQEKYMRRVCDLRLQVDMKNEIVEEMYKLGFVVNVGWVSKNSLQYGAIQMPEVVFVDRVSGLFVETDHERKKFDAQQRMVSDLPVGTEKLLD